MLRKVGVNDPQVWILFEGFLVLGTRLGKASQRVKGLSFANKNVNVVGEYSKRRVEVLQCGLQDATPLNDVQLLPGQIPPRFSHVEMKFEILHFIGLCSLAVTNRLLVAAIP